MTVDSSGNLYICSRESPHPQGRSPGRHHNLRGHRIRKVTPAGIISTIAGTGVTGFGGDGGDATKAMLNMPRRLTIDPAGKELYLADTGNHCIRRIALTKASAR